MNMAKKTERKLPACFQQGMGETGLPKMSFSGRVYYCSREDDCNFICSKLRAEKVAVVGFDMEWKVTYSKNLKKTALVQLCPSQDICYLFHIVMMNGFPKELKLIIENDVTMKVGVGINSDMQKLKKDFNIEAKGYLDLSDIANKKFKCDEKWSLNGLTMNLFLSDLFFHLNPSEAYPKSETPEYPIKKIFGKQEFYITFKHRITKDTKVRCSDWEKFPLSETQEQYAAIDAYVCYAIYHKLIER